MPYELVNKLYVVRDFSGRALADILCNISKSQCLSK